MEKTKKQTTNLLLLYILDYHYYDIYYGLGEKEILKNLKNTSSIVLINLFLKDRKEAIAENHQQQVNAINNLLSILKYDLFRELQDKNISVLDINQTLVYKEPARILKLRKRKDINLNFREFRRVISILNA
ncbi:MAG: hypothetical protein ACI4WW_02680 [Candidatus Coprovivens sp.]